MSIRSTNQYVEMLATSSDGTVRVTGQYVEVLTEYNEPIHIVDGEDSISLVDEAVCILVHLIQDTLAVSDAAVVISIRGVEAEDLLNLLDTVIRVHTVSAYDLVAPNDQANALYVRISSDTLSLSDEAIAEIAVVRAVTDTLSLVEEASFDAVYQRASVDTLALQDEAVANAVFRRRVYESLYLTDLVNRIISASDALTLSDEATADRVLRLSDSLSLNDAVTAYTIHFVGAVEYLDLEEATKPGHVTQRDVTDTLNLVETSVGDRCKVADDTLVLTDEADYEFCRLIHDELELSDEATFAGVFKRKGWDFLSLTDELHHDKELDATASDALSLSEAAVVAFWAIDTLSLSDTVVGIASRAVYDTLSFSETAIVVRDRRAAFDTIILSDQAIRVLVKSVKASDIVNLRERAWPGFQRVTAEDVLQTEHVDYDPYTYEETITYDGLQDVAVASIVYAQPKEFEDHLSFAENALCIRINVDAIAVTASDTLALSEKVRRNKIGIAAELITLDDTATVVDSKLLADELDLSDTASFSINRNNLAASDTIQLSEAVLWYNQLEDYLYVYHPFVGVGTGDVPTPPAEELEGPIVGITTPFQLVYPPTSWPFTDTLTLRAPNLGNRDRLQMNRISRETRGGTLIVYADLMWPKIQTLVLDFSGLTQTEASGLHTFMDSHLGLEVGLLDWEHRFWRGVITKLDNPVVQDGKGCKYSVGFEFEGELAMYPGP